jgi:hypothetical protein
MLAVASAPVLVWFGNGIIRRPMGSSYAIFKTTFPKFFPSDNNR